MKLKIQAQQLQPGDIVDSGETIVDIEVMVTLRKDGKQRTSYWNKYTLVNVERPELPAVNRASHYS